MKWHIVADSSCDLFSLPEAEKEIDFATVPFLIHIGSAGYMDDEKISVQDMLSENESSNEPTSAACPSPQAWLDLFSAPGPVIAFTISSALSGSYNSACTACEMLLEEEPEKQIAIIDARATGPETVLLIRRACELIHQSFGIAEIEAALHQAVSHTHIIFALSSFRNLIKAGRVSCLMGFLAGHLGIWGIGIGDEHGEIRMHGKASGMNGMIRSMVEEIKKTGLAGTRIVICHCLNEKGTFLLKEKLCEAFWQITVDILPTRGLDSYYAERRGLIVAY